VRFRPGWLLVSVRARTICFLFVRLSRATTSTGPARRARRGAPAAPRRAAHRLALAAAFPAALPAAANASLDEPERRLGRGGGTNDDERFPA